MERLTKRTEDGNAFVIFKTKQFGTIANKLAMYEDLEELLEQAYGECPGLLEKAIKHLIKHEGAEFEKPLKSRLLTDEDVDRWLEYKDLDERGLLKKLPCRLGSKLYDICEFTEGEDSPDIYVIDVSRIELSEDKAGMSYCIDNVDYRDYDFGTTVFTSEEAALEAIRNLGWII